MSSIKEKLNNMFLKVVAGTVTREEGAMLLNHLAKEDPSGTAEELSNLVDTPPQGVYPKTILHMVALARNKVFYEIMASGLVSRDEEISMMSAQELARIRSFEARNLLTEHLNHDSQHVRKASALALIQGFPEGLDIVRRHVLGERESELRSSSAQALVESGRKGIEALLALLGSGSPEGLDVTAEALADSAEELGAADVQKIFEALTNAGDREDNASIIGLLRVAASLRDKARGFEGFIQAFADSPFEQVRSEATSALRKIRP
ncbi:MAG: HEAT repeat domain-containing protein [Deltaproteobacteria bacterium]|nr:HEAT repeat domain-containing protein [Deltaproteobacteria bacterium]MBZ0220077.1 HEAT repeat domain-containing protein [Deltaproteobacteria bacterium]